MLIRMESTIIKMVLYPIIGWLVSLLKNVLSNIYREKQINSELPLKISLINNRFWQIEGSLPPNMTGGTAIIVIKKDDGQIQYIRHTK